MNKSTNNCAVKIATRERPSRHLSHLNNEKNVISYHPNANILIVDEKPFSFDHVLTPQTNQHQVYETLIKPLVVKFKQGFNCTALAYGQTGTGKSYTMGLSSHLNNVESENVGVVPRCLNEIFLDNGKVNNSEEFSVSFIEIYNEKVYDLLSENTNEPIMSKGCKFAGGVRKPITNIHECFSILNTGNKNRHVRPTKINTQSSRSHAIFTIHLLSRGEFTKRSETVMTSCMNLVDLAGSEGVRRTGHKGIAMSEGVNINQGLLSIGKVLNALAMGSKVIPYRDSVLSSVLQESLNTNAYLTLVACISPHQEDLYETLSTLRFAQNAKQLKNTPQINTILADIKKNTKPRQTTYDAKQPMLRRTLKTTPFKRPHTGIVTNTPKPCIKSNTFCTPTKQRKTVNKCNQSEIVNIRSVRDEGSSLQMFEPSGRTQLDTVYKGLLELDNGSKSQRSTLCLNLSTSTAIDGPTPNNFSPLVRKYVAQAHEEIETKLFETLKKNWIHVLTEQTPVTAGTSIVSTDGSKRNTLVIPPSIRQELKNIMKEVLNEKDTSLLATRETSANRPTKCHLSFNEEGEFKIPEVPKERNLPITSSPLSTTCNNAENTFTENFYTEAALTEKTVLNKSIRRSKRLSERNIPNARVSSIIIDNINTTQTILRRSCRKSVLNSYKTQCPCGMEEEPKRKDTKDKNKSLINNVLREDYDHDSKRNKTNLNKHRKAILELLNKGTMKELQILPQIGSKTAFHIVTHRTLHGRFKNLNAVEKLPLWRGNGWERFARSNMLV